jgi:hypothetical protein
MSTATETPVQRIAFRETGRYVTKSDFGTSHTIRQYVSVPITKTGATAKVPDPYRDNAPPLIESIWRDEDGNLYRERTIIDYHGGGFYVSGDKAVASHLNGFPNTPCEIDGVVYKTYEEIKPIRFEYRGRRTA